MLLHQLQCLSGIVSGELGEIWQGRYSDTSNVIQVKPYITCMKNETHRYVPDDPQDKIRGAFEKLVVGRVDCCWPSPALSVLVSDPVGTHDQIFSFFPDFYLF
jgi:hypothetical protein